MSITTIRALCSTVLCTLTLLCSPLAFAADKIWIDVRSAEEFATGRLPNSKNIPLKELESRIKEIEKSKANVVITVCASGVRSSSAVSILNKAGFEKTFSLDGGVAAWQSQGLPTVK